MITRYRLIIAALLLAAVAIAAPRVSAQDHAPAAAQPHGAAKAADDHGAEDDHGDGWMPTVWKIANFAILVGVLVYFLRTPLMTYLNGRIGMVRVDLVTAAQTREAATRALAEIDAKLKALPAELAALKQRGAEDIAAERVRIREAAETERQRLLEHTRREIDMRFRVAKRELRELTANLAVGVASERIKASITPEDQARMIDRYSAQLGRGEARQ